MLRSIGKQSGEIGGISRGSLASKNYSLWAIVTETDGHRQTNRQTDRHRHRPMASTADA